MATACLPRPTPPIRWVWPNTDFAKQLGAGTVAARMWRLAPGQASTRHRHVHQAELDVLLEGTGRMRVGDEVLTLERLSAVHVAVQSTHDPADKAGMPDDAAFCEAVRRHVEFGSHVAMQNSHAPPTSALTTPTIRAWTGGGCHLCAPFTPSAHTTAGVRVSVSSRTSVKPARASVAAISRPLAAAVSSLAPGPRG